MPERDSSRDGRLRALLSVPRILVARLSSRRDQFAFTANPSGRFELFSLSLSTLRLRQLTHGELPRSPIVPLAWSTDDRTIALGRDVDGDELHDLYRLTVDTGHLDPLTQDRTCMRMAWQFSPDGNWLLYVSDKGKEGERRQPDLWRVPTQGGPEERLTHHVQPVYPWYTREIYRPDSKKIVYAASDTDDPKDLSIYVAESDGTDPELVYSTRAGSRDLPAGWSPDGRRVAFSTDAFDRIRTGVLEIDSRAVRWLDAGPYDEIPSEFSPDGRALMTQRSSGLRTVTAVIDLGTGRSVVSPYHRSSAGEAGFGDDGQSVIAETNASEQPNRVVRWDLRSGRLETLWSPPLAEELRNSLVGGRVVRYPTFDGREIEAMAYSPSPTSPTRRAPAIVVVHGGPNWQWFDEFDGVAQFLVSEGYVLLLPNIRGSIGYGAVFRDLILRDVGGGDLKDLVAAARYLSTLPEVDRTRIGITGVSYGGYMTYLALTKEPEYWAAGCAEAGITDWRKGYEIQAPALQHLDRMLLGDPVENAALWSDRSPVNFVETMTAPILIIHGVNDPRCPVLHARLFRDRLRELGRKEGRDFEYLEYSDEGHSSWDIEQQMRSVAPMADFFRRHLRDRTGPDAASGDR